MRILQVTTVAATLRSFLLPYARHFRALGWRVEAAAAGVCGCAECEAAFDGVYEIDFARNPLAPGNFTRALGQLRQVLAQGRYDIVHVHTPVAAFVTRLAARKLRRGGKTKVIYTAHGFHFHPGGGAINNLAFIILEKLAGHWTDKLIVINREDAAVAGKYRLVPPHSLCFMPGIGVDTSLYCRSEQLAAEARLVRKSLGLAGDDKAVLMIAEFNPGKRHNDALAAMGQIADPRVHLLCAGQGKLAAAARDQAARLGLADRVHLLGYRTDIPALIAAADMVILPSEREGLPRSVMEALCLECPVAGADVRGIRDLLAGGCGVLFSPGKSEQLAAAIAWIIDNPGPAGEMGRRGRRRMADYDIAKLLERHVELYRCVCRGDGCTASKEDDACGVSRHIQAGD